MGFLGVLGGTTIDHKFNKVPGKKWVSYITTTSGVGLFIAGDGEQSQGAQDILYGLTGQSDKDGKDYVCNELNKWGMNTDTYDMVYLI